MAQPHSEAGQDTVSVVVPAHNASPFVADAIQSVLTQTVPPLEVIVVDDGSTDDTPAILSQFGDRISVLRQDHSGLSAARNAGAAVAAGQWIAFLDADDTWLPTKLERQLAAADEGVAIVYTDRFNVGARRDLPPVQSQVQALHDGDIFLTLLTAGNCITASSVLIRTDVFRDVGGFDNSDEAVDPAGDWDLWIRVAEGHRIGVCAEPLIRYRFHSANMSGNARRMQKARTAVVRRALCSPRGRALPFTTRRRILANTANVNAMTAARRGDHMLAWREYLHALSMWPLSGGTYYDIARFVCGRWRSEPAARGENRKEER